MIAAALASGIALVAAPDASWRAATEVTGVLGFTLLIFAWYCLDARERAFRRGRLQDFGVAAVALLGMPVYLFRSRGARRGALAFGGMLLFYLLLLVTMVVGGMLGVVVRAIAGMPLPG